MTIKVDLRAPTIPANTRVWRLFPGEHYQFLPAFQDQKVGFLDFPGLELPEGDLSTANDLVPRIARTQQIIRSLRESPDADANPPLSDFMSAPHTGYRSRLETALVGFYQEAKQDDYIILPEPIYMSRVWVGKFMSDEVVHGFYPRRYGAIPIPAHRIDWVASFAENMLSVPLSQSLRHQHPFTFLQRSLYVETISLVHGSFVYGDRHVSTIYNDRDDFLDADAAVLGAVSRLAAAACQSLDAERDAPTLGELLDILLRNPPIEYTCSQSSAIHSVGFNRYISGAIVSLVIAAVMGLFIEFGSGSKADLEEQLPTLQIINTAPNADPLCTARVSDATKRVLHVLGTDKTWALCEAARDGQRRAGMRSSAPARRQ